MTRADRAHSDGLVKNDTYIRCDGFGCVETHPIDHELLGEPCFGTGRWIGWIYVDLNRPDLWDRELRFCGVRCLQWWLDKEIITWGRAPRTPLDDALRAPKDELARARAGLKGQDS